LVFVQKLLMKFEYQSRMGITLDTYEETNITKKDKIYGDETRERFREYYIKINNQGKYR